MPSSYIPPELRQIAERAARGEHPTASVRTLLSWFFASYRTKNTIREIDSALGALGLETKPHYNWTWLDDAVVFAPTGRSSTSEATAPSPVDIQKPLEDSLQLSDSVATTLEVHLDPAYRIGRLTIANRPPVRVAPDTAIEEAITLLLMNDFSQLPVMTGDREVKGIFSWKSLGSRASQGRACNFVREAMDEHCEIGADASLFSAMPLIQEHDCVLIRGSTKKITGIMTPYDISVTFGQLAEPFLVLSEIENHIRSLIRGKFTPEELGSARDPAHPGLTADDVQDLTFGGYMRLLENPERWEKLCLQIERCIFIKELDEVRRIRNDVMHFDPEGTDNSDLAKLRKMAEFLQRLERLRPK